MEQLLKIGDEVCTDPRVDPNFAACLRGIEEHFAARFRAQGTQWLGENEQQVVNELLRYATDFKLRVKLKEPTPRIDFSKPIFRADWIIRKLAGKPHSSRPEI